MPLDTIPNFEMFDFPVGCPSQLQPPPPLPPASWNIALSFGKQFHIDSWGKKSIAWPYKQVHQEHLFLKSKREQFLLLDSKKHWEWF